MRGAPYRSTCVLNVLRRNIRHATDLAQVLLSQVQPKPNCRSRRPARSYDVLALSVSQALHIWNSCQVNAVCCRDAEFLDARCALVAFLYASGQKAEAEGQWEDLQQAQGRSWCQPLATVKTEHSCRSGASLTARAAVKTPLPLP